MNDFCTDFISDSEQSLFADLRVVENNQRAVIVCARVASGGSVGMMTGWHAGILASDEIDA